MISISMDGFGFCADHVELRGVGVTQQAHEVGVVQVAADVDLRDEILISAQHGTHQISRIWGKVQAVGVSWGIGYN